MDKIEEILKKYPFIGEDRQRIQRKIREEQEIQEEYRQCTVKAQVITDMPSAHGTSNRTLETVIKLCDGCQSNIDKYILELKELEKLQEWLDNSFATLTEDERRIIYLRYDERWQVWRIMQRLGIMDRCKFYRIIDSAKEKIRKILFT
jgi:DNA-directed RNA polymerase specialized sigma subunit